MEWIWNLHFCYSIIPVRDRSFITSHGEGGGLKGGYNFLRGLGGQFRKCTNCEGGRNIKTQNRPSMEKVVKLYYYWSKSTFPSKVGKKIRFGDSLSATKCYPCEAWPRNLAAISPTRNVVCMYAHTPMHTAEIWKIYRFFISWKHFYHSIGINISHYVFVLEFPLSCYRLGGVEWIRMWSHRPGLRLLTKPTTILSLSISNSHNFVDLSCVNMHSGA